MLRTNRSQDNMGGDLFLRLWPGRFRKSLCSATLIHPCTSQERPRAYMRPKEVPLGGCVHGGSQKEVAIHGGRTARASFWDCGDFDLAF